MHNRAFHRALDSILHPIPIGAIILLLLNDHFLKQHYPSWWTGKLSDFAGLIFAPLILATFLAWIIPPRLKNQETLVGTIAFALTGMIFALTKTLPQANNTVAEVWEFFAGGPVKVWLDPTDLLALPALVIGWLIWNGSSNHAMRVALPALTLIAIGSLAATATSCEEDGFEFSDGVFCISYFHDSFDDMNSEYTLAINGGRFVSENRGETWLTAYDPHNQLQSHIPRCIYQNPYWRIYAYTHTYKRSSWQLSNPKNPTQIYRFESTKSIQLSEDGGQTWKIAYDLTWIVSEERMKRLGRNDYYSKHGLIEFGPCSNYESPTVPTGPYDATFLPDTGQLFIAMGLDGLLVRQPNGNWDWIAVEQYRLEGVAQLDLSIADLWPQFLMSVAAAVLTFVLIGQYLGRSCETIVATTFAWLIWVVSMTKINLTPFATDSSAFDSASGTTAWMLLGFLPLILGGLVFTISHLESIDLSQVRRSLIVITASSFLASFVPFLRWLGVGSYDNYLASTHQAILLVIIIQVVGLIFMRVRYSRRLDTKDI